MVRHPCSQSARSQVAAGTRQPSCSEHLPLLPIAHTYTNPYTIYTYMRAHIHTYIGSLCIGLVQGNHRLQFLISYLFHIPRLKPPPTPLLVYSLCELHPLPCQGAARGCSPFSYGRAREIARRLSRSKRLFLFFSKAEGRKKKRNVVYGALNWDARWLRNHQHPSARGAAEQWTEFSQMSRAAASRPPCAVFLGFPSRVSEYGGIEENDFQRFLFFHFFFFRLQFIFVKQSFVLNTQL